MKLCLLPLCRLALQFTLLLSLETPLFEPGRFSLFGGFTFAGLGFGLSLLLFLGLFAADFRGFFHGFVWRFFTVLRALRAAGGALFSVFSRFFSSLSSFQFGNKVTQHLHFIRHNPVLVSEIALSGSPPFQVRAVYICL